MLNLIDISRNPFFWTFISIFSGLIIIVVMKKRYRVGRNLFLGFLCVFCFDLGRIVLVLPFCPQPRFNIGGLHWIIGSIILIGGVSFGLLPGFSIRPFTIPDGKVKLKTTGLYSITRNPIYLGEILLSLGLSVMFRSIIGLCLTPLWWAGFLLLIKFEEKFLQETVGEQYLEYKKRVPGRIIPGLPI